MNDFSELENELKKLRPMPPSAELFSRVEQEIDTDTYDGVSTGNIIRPVRFRINWISLGALGVAALFIILARVELKHPSNPQIASTTPAPSAPTAVPASEFIPSGATQVVYHTRDEGLHFPRGSTQPVRRVRWQMRETLQWRNPATGASLLVSYPSEQVELIPVSGQ